MGHLFRENRKRKRKQTLPDVRERIFDRGRCSMKQTMTFAVIFMMIIMIVSIALAVCR